MVDQTSLGRMRFSDRHTFSLGELVHFTPNKASQKLLGELVVHDLAYDCSSCEP